MLSQGGGGGGGGVCIFIKLLTVKHMEARSSPFLCIFLILILGTGHLLPDRGLIAQDGLSYYVCITLNLFNLDYEVSGGVVFADMLGRSNLIALVGGGQAPRFPDRNG